MFYITTVLLNAIFAIISMMLLGPNQSILISVTWIICTLVYIMLELINMSKKRDAKFYSKLILVSLAYLVFSSISFMIKLLGHNISCIGIAIHLVFVSIIAYVLMNIYTDYTKNK